MIYENVTARLLHELEHPGADAYDHGTAFANEVQRMADELAAQQEELVDTHEQLSTIVTLCRAALAKAGAEDVSTWAPALVRDCLTRWQPGSLDGQHDPGGDTANWYD